MPNDAYQVGALLPSSGLDILQPKAPRQISGEQLQAPYLVYNLATDYRWDNGILQLPVAYSTPTAQTTGEAVAFTSPYTARQEAAIIQVAAPYGLKIVTFEIVRMGAKPSVPDPTPTSDNEALALVRVRPEAPRLMRDGLNYTYRVAGIYVYRLLRPYWQSDNLFTGGTSPADTSTKVGNTLTADRFVSNLA